MTVTNNTTLISAHNAAETYTTIGSGQGAALNADLMLEGAGCSGRKADNVTNFGYYFNTGGVWNLSGAGTHLLHWFQSTTATFLTGLDFRIGSATATDYENHVIDNYPQTGGYLPYWVEVDAGTDTGTPDFSNADEFGVTVDMGNISANLHNVLIDQTRHSTRAVATLDGTAVDTDDILTSDQANFFGCMVELGGKKMCYSNFQVGSATATTVTENDGSITWPDSSWLGSASTWLGIDVDLQNASTDIDWQGMVFESSDPAGATARPDFLVTGTSGVLDVSGATFAGQRAIDFNSQVTAVGCVFNFCGAVDLTVAGSNGADITGSTIKNSTVAADASALVWNVNADPDGELDDTTHEKGATAHHAIELGTTSPLTMTFRGLTSTGFNASDSQNDSFFSVLRTSGTVTINVIGGTGNFSYKSAGATVNVVIDPVTTLFNVKDETGANLQNARVLCEAGNGAGDLPFEETVTITSSGTTASVSHTAHGLSAGDKVTIRFAAENPYNGVFSISNVTTNAYDYTMGSTASSPATIASGKAAITSTGVVVEGLTNASGQVSASRTFTVNQAVRYKIMKSGYKAIPASGYNTDTVDNSAGLTVTQQMSLD